MLVCDICNQVISFTYGNEDGAIIDHFTKYHRKEIVEALEDLVYEWDGYDPREEALTAGERNPTLK